MLHPEKARVVRELKKLARPAGEFDARRYFRGPVDLAFYNTGTTAMRAFTRELYAQHRADWSFDDAIVFADALVRDRYLETKAVGIELLARYRRCFTPRLLAVCKRWLVENHAANWATTDSICGSLIGPFFVEHPERAAQLRTWARHPNLWVRRASVVALIPLVRTGAGLDIAYGNAAALHGDGEDLVQKAVGWMLREAGKINRRRLERYLLAQGRLVPRTTLRYAIERFPAAKRRALLQATRGER